MFPTFLIVSVKLEISTNNNKKKKSEFIEKVPINQQQLQFSQLKALSFTVRTEEITSSFSLEQEQGKDKFGFFFSPHNLRLSLLKSLASIY